MDSQPQKAKKNGVRKNLKKKPRPRPPLRQCAECGVSIRGWKKYILCRACIKKLAENKPEESLRDFRKRLNDT